MIVLPHPLGPLMLGMPLHNLSTLPPHIHLLVITGGPCAGKSTGMSYVQQKLEARGYKVLVVPEVATQFFTGGLAIGKKDLSSAAFQGILLRQQLAQENAFVSAAIKYAEQGKKIVVLFDRGALDGEAYVSGGHEEYGGIISSLGDGFCSRVLCEERYHAVFHLRTAALGAAQFYTTANNGARQEKDLGPAIKIDELTLRAWQANRHPHIRVINNNFRSFNAKIKRLFANICQVLGIPEPHEIERKFLIEPIDFSKVPESALVSRSHIHQDYLVTSDAREEIRVRRRGTKEDGFSFYQTMKREVSAGERVEIERLITRDAYTAALGLKDPEFQTVEKERSCFFYGDQFFEADEIIWPRPATHLLEIEMLRSDDAVELPPFVKVIKEVTGEKKFSNREIARIPKWKS